MRKCFIFFIMLFPLMVSAQVVKKDSSLVRIDSSSVKKDSLEVSKVTTPVKKETLTPKRDSAAVMKEAVLLAKKKSTDKTEALVINESRFNISGGMGLNIISVKDVVSYLNSFIYSYNDKYKNFTTAPEFYLNCEYRITEKYGLKLEYGYSVKTYNMENTNDIVLYNLNISYYIHSPSLMVNYIIRDPGYLVKFGAGFCFNIANFTQKVPNGSSEENYSASGLGIKLDAYGHTQLGSNVYMVLGLNLNAGFLGDLKNSDGEYLTPKQKVNMSFISAGLSFGLAYYF
jgi:hypothetical protein